MTGRSKTCFAALFAICAIAFAELDDCCAQDRIAISTIDADTRWAFRSLSPVTIHSSILRLGDVVRPLDPNMAGWNRLKGSPIALLPLDGTKMTIQRERLTRVIHDAEATPQHLDWIGPKEIVVSFTKALAQSKQPAPSGNSQLAKSSAVSETGDAVQQVAYSQLTSRGAPVAVLDALNELEAERVIRWINLAIDRQLPSLATAYAVDIDASQESLVSLRAIAGVSSIAVLSPPSEGLHTFRLVARTVQGNVQTEFEATLSKHPLLVVPKQSLARGHRIHESDLIMKPFDKDDASPDFLREMDLVVGRESRKNIRAGQPIRDGDIGAPIEVHRGDLVELRVNGGGISVTTNAKALGDGAASDLIEVETMQPRKRVHARVVQSGVVEIVTRAPRVR